MDAAVAAAEPGRPSGCDEGHRWRDPALRSPSDGPAERFLGVVGDRHPVVAFFLALISGYLLLGAASVALGFLVTEVLLPIDGVERFDERFPRWLAGERTDSWTDASWVGSELSGAT